MEVGRRIDDLHQKLREVTGFLGNVQKSLDTVLSVLEEVEHNVKTLSNQTAGTPLVRLPVMPELPTTPQLAGKSLRDEDDRLEAGPNEERKKKRRTDDIPTLRDITTGGAADKTAEGEQEPAEPTEETICSSGTDC
jgi:hypothetical protein